MRKNAMLLISLAIIEITSATTCYKLEETTKPYEIISTAIVATQGACEALCDADSTCVAISFKEAGSSSSCVLLKPRAGNDVCGALTKIFLKQTVGCERRVGNPEPDLDF